MPHNENIQTFEAISKHLEMEEERIKAYTLSNVAFVAKGSRLKGNMPYHGKKPCHGKKPKSSQHPLITLTLKVVLLRSIRLRPLKLKI